MMYNFIDKIVAILNNLRFVKNIIYFPLKEFSYRVLIYLHLHYFF